MAVTTIEPIPKSQPDNSKLNTFTGHTVTVTKHTAPRNSVGQMVVATQPMKLNAILELMTSIPMAHGPGFYRFTVSDTGGTGDDVWMVKLGPDIQEGSQMGNVTPIGPGGPPSLMPGTSTEGVRQIGPGYFYDENLGLLTTPWREIVQWRPGDTLPKPPTTPVAGAAPHANPWWSNLPQMQPGMPGGWGSFPAVNDSSEAKVRELEAKLVDADRRREADANREEIRRIAEEAQKRADAQEQRFNALIEKLTTKPSGPTEAEQRLERELADQRRRTEEREREDRKMKAIQDNTERLIREQNANRPDPMMPLLMTMMTASQAQAQESVKAIQASTTTAAAAAERGTQELVRQLSTSVMSPVQLMQLIQSAKGEGAEAARLMVESTKDLMAMQKDVYSQLLDVAGQSGQPPWVSLVQEAMSKVGAIGQAIAEKQNQPQPQPVPQQRTAPPVQQRVAPVQQQRAIPPQTQTPPRPTTAAEMRDQAAAQVPHLVPVPEPVVHAAPMNGAISSSTAAVPQPAAQPAPSRRRKPQKHRRSGRTRAQAAPPPPADPKGYSMEELRALDPATVREGTAGVPDDVFFTALLPYVLQLRANNLPPVDVAKYVMQARAQAVQQDLISPAIELLLAEQLDVLVERLFPEATPAYRDGVTQALGEAISAESGVDETDDDDDDEEGDDEGDDAQA